MGEPLEGLGFAPTCEIRNGGDACLAVGKKIQHRAVGPPVACEHRFSVKCDVIVQMLVSHGEEIIKMAAHGQNGRAGIDRPGSTGHRPHFATGTWGGLDQGNPRTCGCQADGGGQSPHSCADHRDMWLGVRHAEDC